MEATKAQEVQFAIELGEVDAELGLLKKAIERRQREIERIAEEAFRTVSRATAKSLKAGDVIEMGGTLRPKYLCGLTATVTAPVSAGDRRVAVKMGTGYAYRKFAGAETRLPVECIEAVVG